MNQIRDIFQIAPECTPILLRHGQPLLTQSQLDAVPDGAVITLDLIQSPQISKDMAEAAIALTAMAIQPRDKLLYSPTFESGSIA
jgi:hypothetical protein